MPRVGQWWIRAAAVVGRRPTLDEIANGDRVHVHAAVRLLARAVPMAEGDLLCRVLGRRKMLADGRDLSLTPHLALDGCWEMPLTRVLLGMLRPGMQVADVGANVGYFTLLMAEAVGPSGRVSAFEPNPRAADRLRRNLALNGFNDRVRLYAEPLGAEEGRVTSLHFDPRFLGGGHVGDGDRRPGLERVAVTSRRLDGVPDADALELIKIDAEGSEAAIWAGMPRLAAGRRLRTVILDWEPGGYVDAGAALVDFAQAGFEFGLVTGDGVVPVGRDALLATPAGRATMLVLRR